MKTKKVIAEIKELYKLDKNLAIEASQALGFKIIKPKKDEQQVVAEIKALYKKDKGLAVKVAKVLGYRIEAGWGSLPKGWTRESVKKFWGSLTGDSKHKISQCMGKMQGRMSNPGAFCASLAKKVGYSPKIKEGSKRSLAGF